MVLNRDAMMIFAIIDTFLRGADTHKRSSMLESFPPSFDCIPWRRVYKQVAEPPQGSSTAAHPIMEHWEASELSFGGAGAFWCFTELQRSGENVSRKTEDGQTWLSKSGRAPRNGFPDQIRVDKLVISGKVFHMIELTLNQEKPTIALCKIWRKGNSEAASPQTPKPSVFSPGASTASLQVFENHFLIPEGWTEMQIDQPQGQLEGASQQHMPTNELPMGSNLVVPDSTRGQTEGVSQQHHMPGHALPMGINIAVPDSIRGCVSSIAPDEDSTYQDVVSFLHETKGSFRHVARHRKEEARWIASTLQNAAAYLKNMFKFLGINAVAESTRPCTQLTKPPTTEANPDEVAAPEDEYQLLPCSCTQQMEPAATTEAEPDELAPEDESPDKLPSCSLEDSFFDVAMYLNLDGGNCTDIDPDEAM